MPSKLFFWTLFLAKRVSIRFVSGYFKGAVGVLVLLLGSLALVGCEIDGAAPEAPEAQVAPAQAASAQAVRVATISARSMRHTLDYVGTVRASRQVAVSAQLPGTLSSLAVDRGDRVAKGQLLAEIEAEDIAARRGQIRAEIRRAKTEHDYLCERFATDKELAEAGVIHGAQLDASRNQCYGSAQAVAAAQAKLGELEATLKKGAVRSPVDGYVLERSAEPGEDVGPGRPLLVLATDGLEVLVPVVESDLRRGIDRGTPAVVGLSQEVDFDAEVDEIAPAAKGPARSAEVTVTLSDSAERLRPGMSVDVSFVLAELDDATPVPREALVATEEGWAIFVVDGDTASRVEVERGISESGFVAVEPKLDDGAKVAVSNLDVLRDGARVYAVEAPGGKR
ncbi:MAG: efflux RND transporter periplasmic adaptor subunit [Persicimonas sp.]